MARRMLSSLTLAALLLCATLSPIRAESPAAPSRFYNPKGGSYLHRNPYCTTVAPRFLPLQALPTGASGTSIREKLTPCLHCGTTPTSQRPADPLATVFGLPYGMAYDACKALVSQWKQFALDEIQMKGTDDNQHLRLTPSAGFTIWQSQPDQVDLEFSQGKLTSISLYDWPPRFDGPKDTFLAELLPKYYALLFHLEAAYGAPTNGLLLISEKNPLQKYNYPMSNGERDTAQILRLLRQIQKKTVGIAEVYGNVSLIFLMDARVVDGAEQATGSITLRFADRDTAPQGSLAPFVWPNGDYAE